MEINLNLNKETIDEMKKLFGKRNKFIIIGKGPTAKHCKNDDEYYTIGVKQGIIFSENQDMLFLTDFEGIFGLENIIKDIKFIVIPDYPHIMHRPNKNYSYKKLIEYIKKYDFKGNVFIYQLHTTINEKKYKEVKFRIISTFHFVLSFLNKYFNMKECITYGVCNGSGYHKEVIDLDFNIAKTGILKKEFNNHYNKFYLNNAYNKKTSGNFTYSESNIKKYKEKYDKFAKDKFKITYN